MKCKLSKEEIEQVLKIKEDDLYDMIYNMNYDDFYPYHSTFLKLITENTLFYDYKRVIEQATELGGKVVFPKKN